MYHVVGLEFLTSDKIDWATIKNISIPVKTYDYVQKFGNGSVGFRVYRFFNLVLLNGTFVLTSSGADDQWNTGWAKIKTGYRPKDNTYIPITGTVGGNFTAAIGIHTDGSIYWSHYPSLSGAARYFINGIYFTNDSFPS